MPFPIGAVIGAVAGIGSAILGSASSQAQANAQYQEAEKQAKKRYERDVAEWELANLVAETQWWWDKARVEQLRFNERQKESDYYGYQKAMITAAADQLGARMSNIQLGLASQLTGLQMRDSSRVSAIGIEAGGQLSEVSSRLMIENQTEAARAGFDYASGMQRLTLETMEAARQYLLQANDKALEADQLTARINTESQELIQSLVLEEQRDYLGWQLNKIAALAEGAQQANAVTTRQGGGKTAKLVAMQAAKQLGRTWGELEVRSKARQTRLGLLNNAIKSEYSMQMGRYALGIQDLADKTAYAILRGNNESTLLNQAMKTLTIPSLGMRAQLANVQMNSILQNATSRLNVTVADNAAGQGAALADYITAKTTAMTDFSGTVAGLSRPFRKEEYFDPLKPIPGLKPEYIGPTQPSGGNAVFTIGNAILGGVQGAMNFSYKGNDGKLNFY